MAYNCSACTTRNTKSCAGLGPTSLWSWAGLSSFRFVCFKEEGSVRGFWLATWRNLSKKSQRAPTNKPQPNGHNGGGSKSFGFQIPVLGNWHCQFVIIKDEECIQSSASASVDLIFKFEKILPGIEKSASMSPARVKNPRILENKIECQTPEKINEPLNTKYHEGYRIMADLFDHMNCSLRLLRLRKRSPTFQNISTQVEVLAKRKFLYKHLAQMKFILPEAIKIDRILVQDKKTPCMKTDMNITLLFDIVEGHGEVSDFIAVRQVFASRLINFFAMHPEACDVPEAILPEPFSQRREIPLLEKLPINSSMEFKATSNETELFLEKVHPYPYVSRHFSHNAVVAEAEKAQLLASPVPLPSSGGMNNHGIKNEQKKEFPVLSSKPDSITELDIKKGQQNKPCSKFSIINHSVQLNHPQRSSASSVSEGPLVKLTSSADSIMIETPTPLTPRRSMPSCDAKHVTMNSQSASCHKPAKRILDFSHLEGDKISLDCTADESDCYKVVNKNIPKTKEGLFEDGNVTCSLATLEVEQILGCGNEDLEKSQKSALLCQQMSACPADLVTIIHSIFKSLNWSPITKEELVHKIIMNNFDVVERREVEEQIDLLERHVPDWIHRKSSGGDTMYNIKKVPNLNLVLSKLKANMII
ncbi:PREDICTED: CDT1 [Prunus dulcis]|uniref:PREDICTED: CDT1 n=3 Tax=Prunus dulcis TaxID=3755 RepID=A0A5E4EVZ1_PRUDU|nr:PREDICTED: CDT1 [Prunus dulcis]